MWVITVSDQYKIRLRFRAFLVGVAFLRFIEFLLRLAGSLGYYIGRFIVNVYDLIIFPTIWLEGLFVGNKSRNLEDLEAEQHPNSTYAEKAIGAMDDSIEYKEPQK